MFLSHNSITNIHFFGDSLTAGYGVSSGKDWVTVVSKRMPNLTFYNHSTCGAFLQDMIEIIPFFLRDTDNKNAVFLMAGTNDILSGLKLHVLKKQVEQAIETLSVISHCFIGIPPLMTRQSIFSGWQAEWAFDKNINDLKVYGSFIENLCCKNHIPYIDFSKAFPSDDTWYIDGVHPNENGHLKFADSAEKIFRKYIK